ncbi:M20 aminoacylase family protein [Inquilinus sp. Marseille-Q2685]|uniref:M20 aminoacylase family protein n=1 Tax=Inquilinus sp. Marseille-Q2685 TaxID=2866581 RepID=UPI001CE48074|nr:M20 aminoacylase family protein [Inquilinus sp. Marseille-Q2685]
MKIDPMIAGFADELTEWRRDIHAHPELGFEEHRTSALVAERLRAFGCEVATGIGRTGVVGTLRVGNNPRAIALRADMDALPMQEANGFGHRSRTAGTMHACGHDGHTTMLLGAARYLAATRNFDGTVHFIFQPAEEGRGGAQAMIADGLFDQFPCEAVFGMHNFHTLEAGRVMVRPGATMSGGGIFDIEIAGRGAHGALPETGVDPVLIAAHVVTALQSVVARNVAALDSAVVSVTQIHAGDAYNVIPDTAVLRGTFRALRMEVLEALKARIETIARDVAAAFGGRAEPKVQIKVIPVINDDAETAWVAEAAVEALGADAVDGDGAIVMASEDFAYMLAEKPGAFLFIGNGKGSVPVHNPHYDFNDEILPVGATLWSRLVETRLKKTG